MKPNRLHPADAADRAAIPGAALFIASLFLGIGRFAKAEAQTLEAARRCGERFAAHYRNGRAALVYAILPDGRQVLVPDDYQPPTQPQEAIMAKRKTYPKKFNAERAAKAAGFGPDRFKIVRTKGGFTYRVKDAAAAANKAEKSVRRARKADGPAEAAETPAARPLGKRAAIEAAARAGTLPVPPDFSAATHARFRNKLANVIDLAKAGDLAGLRAVEINPVSSSPKAIARYRDLCVIAIEAQANVTAAPAT